MTIIGVDVDVAPAHGLLDTLVQRLENDRGIFDLLGGLLEDYERDVFATRGSGTWAPDSSDTIELKGSGRVLVDTGNLLNELTHARRVGEAVQVDAGDAYYARFLRDGDRGMPKRNPAPAPDGAQVSRWGDQLVGFLIDGRRR